MSTPNRPPLFSVKLVLGLIVIMLGVLLLGEQLQWFDPWRVLVWWPLALVALGLARLVQDGPLSFRGHALLAFAAAGFLQQFGPWGLLDRWWPVFLVWAGLVVTLRALFPRAKPTSAVPPPSQPPPVSHSWDPGTGSDQPQVKP